MFSFLPGYFNFKCIPPSDVTPLLHLTSTPHHNLSGAFNNFGKFEISRKLFGKKILSVVMHEKTTWQF